MKYDAQKVARSALQPPWILTLSALGEANSAPEKRNLQQTYHRKVHR
jgi:hypothetical protein